MPMKILKPFLCLIALTFAAPAAAAERFDIAITVDDLPYHGDLPAGMTRIGIAAQYLQILKAHGVPQAYGFVNAAKLAQTPGSDAVLDAWRAAGYPLGNHTFTHLNLDRAASLEAWQADLIAGEPAVAQRMAGLDWHYLRFPNLSTGATRERHDGAADLLAARGYKVAHVSVSFDDFAPSEAYARCMAKGDQATIALMEKDFLNSVGDEIARMKTVSRTVYGRMIPQVLLAHLGPWSVRTLPAVLDRLDAAGAHYVTLEQAQADPAYKESEAWLGGDAIMDRAARNKAIAIPARRKLTIDPKTACL
jgi:peptidoglycan/xylan/chitin deacetylase (PgdA/CDA1 family)